MASARIAKQIEQEVGDYGIYTLARPMPFLMAAAALQCAVPRPEKLPNGTVWKGLPVDDPVLNLSPQPETSEDQSVIDLLAAFTAGGALVFTHNAKEPLPDWWAASLMCSHI